MPPQAMHDDELVVDDRTVQALIAAQFPDWAQLPVRRLDAIGTDNTILRLGEDLTVRLPRRPGDPDRLLARLQAESRALAQVADHSPVPAPRPVAIGLPGGGFPLPWSVQTWIPGTPASHVDVAGSEELATDLAGLVLALRRIGTAGRTFTGGGRGGHLPDHDAWVRTCLERSEGLLDVPRLRRLWEHFRELPREDADTMNHGDLIPGNILVDGGRLCGVLDGAGLGPADPALDLIVGWHLLDAGPRELFRAAVGAGDLAWERAQAWAFEQSMGLVWYYERTNPTMSRIGRCTLDRLLATGPRTVI